VKNTVFALGALLGSSAVLANAPNPPGMDFLGAPAVQRSGEEVALPLPQVSRINQGDTTTVVVKESAPCGARGTEPAFRLDGNTLHLSYDIASAGPANGKSGCVATSVFTLHNMRAAAFTELEVAEFGPAGQMHSLPVLGSGPLAMRFVGTPAASGMGEVKREVVQSRHGDRMTVVVYEPASCGARPVEPAAAMEGRELKLAFKLAPVAGAAAEGSCIATGVFALRNVPVDESNVAVNVERLPAPPAAPASDYAAGGLRFFVGVPAGNGAGKHEVQQSRSGDRMTVLVTDPAACGSRPVSPTASVESGVVHLSYTLAPASATPGEGPCAATAVFALQHLPQGDLKVAVDTNYVKVLTADQVAAPAAPTKVIPVAAPK